MYIKVDFVELRAFSFHKSGCLTLASPREKALKSRMKFKSSPLERVKVRLNTGFA
jgi:hypothetical protein